MTIGASGAQQDRFASRVDCKHERAFDQPLSRPETRRAARRHPRADARSAGEGGIHSERVRRARAPARRVSRVLRVPRRADAPRFGAHQGRARDDRRRGRRRERLPVLFRRPRRDPADLREESAGRRSGRRQLSEGGRHAAAARAARVRAQGRRTKRRDRRADYKALREHGFDDEDIWDIGNISAFFCLSNRMANLIGLRPNDEFYLLGRVPKQK